MNYDLLNAARISLGRALIAASRHLSRGGAHLLRHPSAAPPGPVRQLRPVPDPSNVQYLQAMRDRGVW